MRRSHTHRWILGVIGAAAIVAGIGLVLAQTAAPPAALLNEVGKIPEILISNEGVPYVVNPSLLTTSGPGRDGISPIETPSYVSVRVADEWIDDDELVLALTYQGEVRAYPLQILVWHDVVNDIIAGDPLLITYCPLSSSGAAYDRRMNGMSATFGTSGYVYNSNTVLYDRITNTYWSQLTGQAIVGQLAGQYLSPIPLDTVVWGEWKTAHPEAEVLSRDTGYCRDYGHDPYMGYCADSRIWFPVQNKDDRIPPKTMIIGIAINGTYAAVCEEDVVSSRGIQVRVQSTPIYILLDATGRIRVINQETGESVPHQRSYWFAWYAFHPDTQLLLRSG